MDEKRVGKKEERGGRGEKDRSGRSNVSGR